MAKCKGCGAEIIWMKTASDMLMPVDPDPVVYWQKPKAKGVVVTKNGQVVKCEFEGDMAKSTGIGYIPHWATCPKAGEFRRKK